MPSAADGRAVESRTHAPGDIGRTYRASAGASSAQSTPARSIDPLATNTFRIDYIERSLAQYQQ